MTIKRLLEKSFLLGNLYFEKSDKAFYVNKVENSTHIYEFIHEYEMLKITDKSTNNSVTGAKRAIFKPDNGCRYKFPKILMLTKKLIGLEDVEDQIKECLNIAGNHFVCLYGPSGCGQTMLMQKLNDSMDHKKFMWFDYIRFGDEKTYIGAFEAAVRRLRTNLVICIPDLESIQMDSPETVELFARLLKDNELDIVILGKISDYGLVKSEELKRRWHRILVRNLNPDENCELLRYMIDIHTTPRETISETGLRQFAGTLSGFSAQDIVRLVDHTVIKYRLLSLDNLIACKQNRVYVPLQLRELVTEVTPLRWTDIGGYDSVKRQLQRKIEFPLSKGRDVAAKGVLLYGPPGCSKTMFARALATECGLYLFAVRPSSVLRGYVGDSEKALRKILVQAQAAAPSILFIDEIDTLLPRSSGDASVTDGLHSELCNFLDSVRSSPTNRSVIFMAATNYPEKLDEELTRKGRIDLHIAIDLPDPKSREAILRIILADEKFSVEADVMDNIGAIAHRLEKRSGAEIVDFGKRIKKSDSVSQSRTITLNAIFDLLGQTDA